MIDKKIYEFTRIFYEGGSRCFSRSFPSLRGSVNTAKQASKVFTKKIVYLNFEIKLFEFFRF